MTRLLLVISFCCCYYMDFAQCVGQAPANPPASLLATTPKKDGFTVTILPGVAGGQPADGFLVVIRKGTAPVTTPQLKAYNKGDAVDAAGLEKVVYMGPIVPTFEVTGLESNTTYHLAAYSALGTTCYNLTPKSTTGKTSEANGEDENTGGAAEGSSGKLSTLLNFNFVGNQNGWSNLTPALFYGWSVSDQTKIQKLKGMSIGNTLQVGPYISSTIDAQDSTSFIPAILLPGNGGIQLNYILTLGNPDKFNVQLRPLGLGLKVISGFKDTTLAVVQHNIRHAFAISYGNHLAITFQYTDGWHNATTNSKENFAKIFPNAEKTKVSYWTIGASMKVLHLLPGSEAPMYLNLVWRTLVSSKDQFNLPNSRFISLGLTTDLNLRSGTHPSLMPKSPL